MKRDAIIDAAPAVACAANDNPPLLYQPSLDQALLGLLAALSESSALLVPCPSPLPKPRV